MVVKRLIVEGIVAISWESDMRPPVGPVAPVAPVIARSEARGE